ncbi:hypothetical protein NGTWS0302_10810 [Mycolicibacterium cyprinidarum]|uniref:Ferrous iron transporter FeoA-like domain-containing protein n=1 Tax=Mycolicibacterium cyprinidarum TaxID=2860311 RepID=A0ABQ4V8X5_9MYCO|nr:hypothetical protein NGTWS1803_20380 [Mycolicibacterium sp. NGTWS1803]GJF13310.1 hypothetical protein NGTWS1702_13440 [Mycolicibacterium sp. NGTWSNA01]GJF16080.1 hypothetical protein NGTWS0302_10810 [Mycolicibacterium sp. NGTWS0302]
MAISKWGSSRGVARTVASPNSLAALSAGDSADIVALDRNAPVEVAARLRHLGFRPGAQVTKLRVAPLGDPALYRLLGYDTCLRRQEAAYVEVRRRV